MSDPASGPSASSPAKVSTQPFADGVTVHRALQRTFLERYEQAMHEDSKLTNPVDDCRLKEGTYRCLMDVDQIFGQTEGWAYRVTVDARSGCFTARTSRRFGAHQDPIDRWRNRKWTLYSRSDIRQMVREARQLRTLRGCVERLPDFAYAGKDMAKFMAGLASVDVAAKFRKAGASSRCTDRGKEAVDFAPDSYKFSCSTTASDGRRYVSDIYCFEDPPYATYDKCGQEDDFPRPAPRALPPDPQKPPASGVRGHGPNGLARQVAA